MNLQFSATIQYSEFADEWLCLAAKEIKPTTERLVGLRNCMEMLAVGGNGNYDGLGTPVMDENYPDAEEE